MRSWLVVTIIGIVVLLGIVGFEIWFLRFHINTSGEESKVKINCEWEGEIYFSGDKVSINNSDGCSFCNCNNDGSFSCTKIDCLGDY